MCEPHDDVTVCIHAFVRLNDENVRDPDGQNLTHADKSDGPVDGWCVYVRKETPDDPQQPFTTLDDFEQDFDDEEKAEEYADIVSMDLGDVQIDNYS